jgi:hypothetical protein
MGPSYEKDLSHDLLKMASNNLLVKDIDIILFHENFPVDIRHNAKIFRELLADWAEKKLR